ncbi:MAG: hypothetical protein HYR70_14270 [Chloroflexi bacterium]|nr:hypothetical protein [Chloroflexota bacterium]MBI3339798.1 hypothetical protein [Chloroflexota bacterium]
MQDDDSGKNSFVHAGLWAGLLNNRRRLIRNFTFFVAGLVLFGIGIACGASAGAPASSPAALPVVETTQPAPASTFLPLVIQPTPTAEPLVIAPPPAILEARRLTLEYPPQIRVGDSDVIRLTLEVDTLGNVTPTAEAQGNTITGEVIQIPNLYDTHNVIAEARLDMAGPQIRPSELISEPLTPGQSATFYWSIRPTSAGTFRGTAWFYLRFVDKVSGEESRKTVSAQAVQVQATSFFGLNGNAARAAGGVGSVLGAILGIPFIDDVLKWVWTRIRRLKNT